MKGKKFLKGLLLAGATSLFLSSCGGGGGGESNKSETVNQASADDLVSTANVGETLYRSIQELISNSDVNISLPSLPDGINYSSISKQQTTSYCTGIPSGNLTDVDDDGIPMDGTYDFTCNYPNNITMSGKISAKDDNDNDPLSGYDICTGSLYSTCSREPITINGSFGTLKETIDFNLDGNAARGYAFTTFYYKGELTSNNTTITAQMNSNNLTYYPDADGNDDPWDKGILNGDINLSASDNQGNSVSLTMSLNSLHVGACSDGSVTGGITLSGTCTQGSTNTNFSLTINLTSCGHGTVNGTNCDGNTVSDSW